ncbi:hypothetical protein M426DRAFT_10750 [Hypoxylon sp. CI-4A]|nr:hypothetical protein M426DRAFT_10750 [Hypoxylon sp. CI-4A]
MDGATESALRNTSNNSQIDESMGARTVPIITAAMSTPTIKMSAPSPSGEPMEITTPTNSSATQSARKSSDGEGSDSNDRQSTALPGEQISNSVSNTMPAPAAAAVHQPKIVQTAFIHKLYNMLEDPNIQHLISWSASAESFVMSPSHDFSKVLAQYFKHTNISSFVRQLNMYGFHKVSDVFHTGSPETAMWEFKHGNGNFKRGDLVGLREIKRRASRHALVHRGDYNNPKPTPSQPGTPAEPMPPIHDGSDPRLANIEHSLYDITTRLQRSEENAHYMTIKNQTMVDSVNRMCQMNQELIRMVSSLVPPENPIHRDVLSLQGEYQRQSEIIRSLDESHEPPFSNSRQVFANLDNPPVSPRQYAQDDQRRLGAHQANRANLYRPSISSGLSISMGPRRSYGSVSTSQSSPSPLRSQVPAPPPVPHPLATVEPPPSGLPRRHTSADIRAHGWQPNPPYVSSGPPSTHWPSSPSRPPQDEQRFREPPPRYSLSRPATPPAPAPFSNGNIGNGLESLNNWSWNSANRENRNLAIKDMSAPPTRRGSMAHILNPTDTIEREDEDDPRGDDDRKRKRMQ